MANLRQHIGAVEQDNLFAGVTMPAVTDSIIVPAGNVFKRGTLLTIAGTASTSGADTYGILTDDVDATDGDVKTRVYVTGEFKAAALIVTGDIADYKEDLRKIGIFLRNTVTFPQEG